MKKLRKMMALVIAMVMMFTMSATVFADNENYDSQKGGSGTLTIKNANADQTYELYRIFEAVINLEDPSKVSYKPLSGKVIPENDFFKVVEGYISITEAAKDDTDDSKLSADAIAWLTTNYTSIGEQIAQVETTDNGDQKVINLPYGYYYVTTTTGTAISVDTTNENATVTDKNPGTTIDKTIIGVTDGSVSTDNEKALAQIGTTVNYEVRIPIAANAKSYLFYDNMSNGLTYKDNSMKVYIVDKDAAVDINSEENNSYGTLKTTDLDNADISIEFSDDMLKNNNGKDIVLHYSAVVNSNALIAEANANTATIYWGNKTDLLKDEDDANVYTAQITVEKTNGSGEALEGAEFKLKKNADNTWYKITDGIVSWVDENNATSISPTIDNEINKAIASVVGLANGEYTLVETVVPAGYNKAADTIITIKDASTNNFTTELKLNTTVQNNAGSLLPSTGGMGTTILYIIGGILVIGAGVLLITKRRMINE